VVLIGLDDTDSPEGGCTTHFALEAAAAFRRELGLVLQSRPRLVRLNPNIPWKTRGNAAVALELGRARGGARGALGGVALDGTELRVDSTAAPEPGRPPHAKLLDGLIEEWCDLGAAGTDPAYVVLDERPPARLYEQAVRSVVDPEDVRQALRELDGARFVKALGDGRGVVGAAAAVAWPALPRTYELTVYRTRGRWGTKRQVAFDSVEAMDRAFPETFNNVDRRNRHAAVAPATPCPILFGVRAFEPGTLTEAAASVEAGEPWGGWLLFETNQGTDAHVVQSTVERASAMETVAVEGTVEGAPRRMKGGHVVFALRGAEGVIDCAAFEPTKEFREVAAALGDGDRVRAVGAVRAPPRTVNLEKLEVIGLAKRPARGGKCAACGGAMKSAGRGGPLRCGACGARAPKQAAQGPLADGWYEVPVAARRHLSRPIDPHGRAPGAPRRRREP
jgi:tRNA(Ile2)-agmatinylcytidine synthase